MTAMLTRICRSVADGFGLGGSRGFHEGTFGMSK